MTGTIKSLHNLPQNEINKIYSFWDSHSDLLFQSRRWVEIIGSVYKHTIKIFCVYENDDIKGCIPCVNMKNILVTLPYIDYITPICHINNKDILLHLYFDYCKNNGLRFLYRSPESIEDLKCDVGLDNFTQRLTLEDSEEDEWNSLTSKVRNQIRKPEKNDVRLLIDDSFLWRFYKLWAQHICELGTPPHSYGIFRGVFDNFPKDHRSLITAWRGEELVGGLILMFDDQTAYVPWASSKDRYKSLCINHALYWEALRSSIRSGKKEFDFLRSQRDTGTYKFKKQWGALEKQLYYYSSNPKTSQAPNRLKAASAIWKLLPFWLTGRLGPHLRKYIP